VELLLAPFSGRRFQGHPSPELVAELVVEPLVVEPVAGRQVPQKAESPLDRAVEPETSASVVVLHLAAPAGTER